MTPLIVGESAMTKAAAVAPDRQRRSARVRPMRLESFTMSGQHSICAKEKADVARPTCMAEAPKPFRCSGMLEIAIPSPSICTKTPRQIGSTAGGSLSSPSPLSLSPLLAVRATAAGCLRGFKERIGVKDSRLFPASGTRGRPATTAGPTCSLPPHPSTWNAVAPLAPYRLRITSTVFAIGMSVAPVISRVWFGVCSCLV